MSRCRIRVASPCALCAVAALALSPVGAAGASRLSVSVSRAQISTKLGDKLTFTTNVANRGPTAARGLIAHLNIVALDSTVYVDPEDWSSHRTSYLRTLGRGESRTITWHMQAVNAGTFDVYVAVLARGVGTAPTTGETIRLTVRDRRTLNSGGILPLALGVPSFLALLALGVRLKRAG